MSPEEYSGVARGTMSASQAQRLSDFSLEVTARSRRAIDICREHLDPGSQVYIAFIPGDSYQAIVATARGLRRAGFVPVPHVAARSLTGPVQLDDFLGRLAGEAEVERALVVGGDTDRPVGTYTASLELLQSELFPAHGISHVGLGCYPEGHPKVADGELNSALLAKLALAADQGLGTWLVSQYCFTPEPIIACAQALRTQGVTAPLRVGLAGPADRGTLLKYSLKCGIGNSIKVLGSRFGAVRDLLVQQTPDDLVADLASAYEQDPGLGIEGLHLFPFGNIAASAAWGKRTAAMQRGRVGVGE